ncbi:bacterial transcriptional activator domain-containing protein [Luteococcus sp.]|uniref:bacterial transcriptional activator domain-containing protein n=1 Tax=Luteococcus sp. TaxID=1969402 RepID=UPI0037361D2D
MPLTVERLNLVLRAIAHHCFKKDQDLPILSAARLANDRIDLLLAEPATCAPDWVELIADGSVWTILPGRSDDLPFQSDDLMDVAAPYPALVSIGHDDDNALILIDLENAGAVTIATTDDAEAENTIRAIALELALGPFAEDLNITLVGQVCPGLETALAEPTVTRVTDVDALIMSLTQRADQQRAILTETDTSVGQNRVQNAADGWDPEIILLDQSLTENQVAGLADLLTELPRVAVAAITTVEQNLSPWRLTVGGLPRTAVLEPHSWELSPLYVSDEDYRNVLELLNTSQVGTAQPASWWDQETQTELAALEALEEQDSEEDATEVDELRLAAFQSPVPEVTVIRPTTKPSPVRPPLPTADLTANLAKQAAWLDDEDEKAPTDLASTGNPSVLPPTAISHHVAGADQPYDLVSIPDPTTGQTAPMLRILGPVTMCNAAGTAGRAQRRCQETMLYMLEHPGCTTADLAAAFVISDKTVKQNASYLRSWLGQDPEGKPYLPSGIGGYRLDERVTTDWHIARSLLAGGVNRATTDNLVQALNIVQGAPFEGVTSHAFAQAEMLRIEIVQSLVDAALSLVDRALEGNDLALARWATGKALQLDPHSEALATARIRTEYQAGNFAEVDRLMRSLHASARAAQMDLCPQTEDVLRKVAAR